MLIFIARFITAVYYKLLAPWHAHAQSSTSVLIGQLAGSLSCGCSSIWCIIITPSPSTPASYLFFVIVVSGNTGRSSWRIHDIMSDYCLLLSCGRGVQKQQAVIARVPWREPMGFRSKLRKSEKNFCIVKLWINTRQLAPCYWRQRTTFNANATALQVQVGLVICSMQRFTISQ